MGFDDGTDIEADCAAGRVELVEMNVKTVMKRKVVCVRTVGEDDSGMTESGANTGSMMTVAEDGLVSVGTTMGKSSGTNLGLKA